MGGAVPPLPQYAFMAWCSVKKAQGQLYLYLYPYLIKYNNILMELRPAVGPTQPPSQWLRGLFPVG